MCRVAELVHRRDLRETIAAVDQDASVAGEGGRIAGHRDHDQHFAGSEFNCLRLRALARWIEYHGLEVGTLLRGKGPAEEIAHLRIDRLQAARCTGGLGE